ncbi:MAG: type VI secretion system tip protein TssI/VgrG [Polyangiaceae bacterium]
MHLDNVTLTFKDSGVTGFQVHEIESHDEVNKISEIRLEVSHTHADLDLTTLVSEAVEIEVRDEHWVKKRAGIVRRVRQLTAHPQGASLYELIIVPPLWLTTRRRDNRIFQDCNAKDVVTQVLEGYGGRIPAPNFYGVEPPKREYRVQYDETDHDFIFRVCAEEGIATYFEDEFDFSFNMISGLGMNMVSRDAVDFIPPSGPGQNTIQKPHVLKVAITSDIQTSKATVRDYDFKKPKYILTKNKSTSDTLFSKEADLEHYEFTNNKFTTEHEQHGEFFATQYLEEDRGTRRTLECQTNFYLAAGTAFTLQHHPRADVNGELRVIKSHFHMVHPTGGALRRSYTLTCIPGDAPFNPPRMPKPRIYGTHLAVVIGETEGSADIDIDQYGRVKVGFHWDRRDMATGNPSRFVRVSQGWAGAGFGMVLHPRVGHEVIVAYIDGDPDEPIIVGRLHNEVNKTPLALPAKKSQSTWRSQSTPSGDGHNEIMMEDQAGEELLEFHAQRNNLFHVNAQQDIFVGAKRNDHVVKDVDEKYDTKRDITIGAGGQTLTIKGTGHKERITGKWDIEVSDIWHSKTHDWDHHSPKVNWDVETHVNITTPTIRVKENTFFDCTTKHFHQHEGLTSHFHTKEFKVEENLLSEFSTKQFTVEAETQIKLHAPSLDIHGHQTLYFHPHVEHLNGNEAVAGVNKGEVWAILSVYAGLLQEGAILKNAWVAFDYHNGVMHGHTDAAHTHTTAAKSTTAAAEVKQGAVKNETHAGSNHS